ncbi:hypothetical protein N0V83_002655 [Neocucurbitaria cava]|uniref:NAD(P)-binding protein n=1 Tax=Neocucurbitaria cava TaxID=798079 RepID=A0A9W8YCH4_9PLEO|nr:hypothetical protein N0V83_002655 [Neocucurbitaria cava]
MSQTILITGASSGLGLAFTKHYTSQPSTRTIIAVDHERFPTENYFDDVGYTPGLLHFHRLDITYSLDFEIVPDLIGDTPVHLIIHCAGIRGLVPDIVEEDKGDVAAAETLEVMDKQTMLKTFETNTWGTFNVIRSFLPNLKLAAKENQQPKVIILSSRMGSISSNDGGGGYAYRASKAALNAVVKSFSVDVPDVMFLLLHPGRVETGLVQWREEGAISVEESVRDCLKVIEGLGRKESGDFVDRFGERIDW